MARTSRARLCSRALDAGLLPDAGRSRDGFPAAKALLLNEPRTLRKLLEQIARATAGYLKAQIAAGAAAVQLFDTWAGELDASEYRDFELPATKLLIDELAPGDTSGDSFLQGVESPARLARAKPVPMC